MMLPAWSSDSQELGFLPTTTACTECLGRAKASLPRMEAKRRTHNRLVPEPANSEGAEADSRFRSERPKQARGRSALCLTCIASCCGA